MATGIFVFLFTVCWHVLVFNGASRVTGVLPCVGFMHGKQGVAL